MGGGDGCEGCGMLAPARNRAAARSLAPFFFPSLTVIFAAGVGAGAPYPADAPATRVARTRAVLNMVALFGRFRREKNDE